MIDARSWPVGLATTVAVGLLIWPIGQRLRLRLAPRAAGTALYAVAALLIDGTAPLGADGRAAFLLAAAAGLAVRGRWRAVVAVAAFGLAVVITPAVGVGFLVLAAGLVLQSGLLRRRSLGWRRVIAGGAVVAAAVLATWPLRTPAADGQPALPLLVLAALTAWTLLVLSLLWRRQPWLRPVGAAAVAVLVCAWLPGTESASAVVVAAAVAVLTVVLVEEYRPLLARQLSAAGFAAAAAALALLAPAGLGPPVAPAPAAAPLLVSDAVAPVVRPLTIAIPALHVSGPLEDLTADPATGELSAPADPSVAGWFAAGVVPGATGPAVIGGHVDSRSGPGFFFRLRSLAPGDLVEIGRSDGRTVRFSVTAVHRYPKDHFPTAAVYGPAPGPELRLVTCGGVFDRSERSYRDNVVVDAVLASA